MTAERDGAPLRVERALRLMPRLESLAPLRALLLSAAASDQRRAWCSSARYLTLGKRSVEPRQLRGLLDGLLRRTALHLAEQYATATAALDHYGRGDSGAAVAVLLSAGAREERTGRLAAARAWYAAALDLAEGLTERRPEIAALLAFGAVEGRSGRFADSARACQRGLVLAEAEGDHCDAIGACRALGDVAHAHGNFAGARAWYARGLQHAGAGEHGALAGSLHLRLAALALDEGDTDAAAKALRRARGSPCQDRDVVVRARLLCMQGTLHEALGDRSAASDYREALLWALRAAETPEVELSIRLQIARHHLNAGRILEAEAEMRRAEERALRGELAPWLVRVYVLMGQASGTARDENGFVFFEQAIETCRALECTPLLEVEAYRAYGAFCETLGDAEAARGYHERVRELLSSLDAGLDPSRLAACALFATA